MVTTNSVPGNDNDYVVCFAGARDNYEVALAVHEVGRLKLLLTDFYLGTRMSRAIFSRFVKAAQPRYREEIPKSKVRQCIPSFLSQKLNGKIPYGLIRNSGQELLERELSNLSQLGQMNVISYAGYALKSFQNTGSGGRKILFQYHPHRLYELENINSDTANIGKIDIDQHNIDEINLADCILCASSFTKKSVERVLKNPTPIIVAPYGVNDFKFDIPKRAYPINRKTNFLFVGSGIKRKGLSVLLKAWGGILSIDANLTLVVRNIDSEIQENLAKFKDTVNIKSNLSRRELMDEFVSADIFVFPSLSEGFGHVVPEALSMGCFTIASDATCLADINIDPAAGRVVQAGSVDSLANALRDAAALHQDGMLDRANISETAHQFSWERFRKKIRFACDL